MMTQISYSYSLTKISHLFVPVTSQLVIISEQLSSKFVNLFPFTGGIMVIHHLDSCNQKTCSPKPWQRFLAVNYLLTIKMIFSLSLAEWDSLSGVGIKRIVSVRPRGERRGSVSLEVTRLQTRRHPAATVSGGKG